jgi:Ca2+-dependent lipid-binding protein
MSLAGGFNPTAGGTAAGLPPSSRGLPTSTLELTVKCENLCDKDVFSKSDPFCVMFIKKGGHWYELGRTETVTDNLSPEWQKKFVVEYSFEERQEVKFEVYDTDSNSSKLSQHDFLGPIL